MPLAAKPRTRKVTRDLLTPDQLAEQLGTSRRTVDRWHAQRLGPPRIKVGACIFYRAEAVREWLEGHEEETLRKEAGRIVARRHRGAS